MKACLINIHLLVPSQDHLQRSRSNIKVTRVQKMAVSGAFVFHKHILLKYSFYSFTNKPWFLGVCITSLLKTLWEKEKWLVASHISFFQQCFYPFWEISAIFINLKNCRLQTLLVWKRLKFVVLQRFKTKFLPKVKKRDCKNAYYEDDSRSNCTALAEKSTAKLNFKTFN